MAAPAHERRRRTALVLSVLLTAATKTRNAEAAQLAVGVYVLAISGDDSLAGVFTADFLLYSKRYAGPTDRHADQLFASPARACHRDALWARQLGKSSEDNAVVKVINGDRYMTTGLCPRGSEVETFTCEQVRGVFTYTARLRDFPFHRQEFTIVVEENADGPVDDACVMKPLSGLSNNIANGIQFSSLEWGTRASAKCYPPLTGCVTGNETACEAGSGDTEAQDECRLNEGVVAPRRRITVYAAVQNSAAKALLRYFLVPAAVCSLTLGSFVMHPIDDLATRHSSVSGLLISTVLFHLSINASAFRSSRFTRFDRTMILSYGLLWLTLSFNITLHFLNRRTWSKGANARAYRRYISRLNFVVAMSTTLVTVLGSLTVTFAEPTSWLANPWAALIAQALAPLAGIAAHYAGLRRLLPRGARGIGRPSSRSLGFGAGPSGIELADDPGAWLLSAADPPPADAPRLARSSDPYE